MGQTNAEILHKFTPQARINRLREFFSQFEPYGAIMDAIMDLDMLENWLVKDKALDLKGLLILGKLDNLRTRLEWGMDPDAIRGKHYSGVPESGGAATAKKRKQESEELSRQIEKEWDRLERNGVQAQNRASLIAKNKGLTPQTVRRHLKKCGRTKKSE